MPPREARTSSVAARAVARSFTSQCPVVRLFRSTGHRLQREGAAVSARFPTPSPCTAGTKTPPQSPPLCSEAPASSSVACLESASRASLGLLPRRPLPRAGPCDGRRATQTPTPPRSVGCGSAWTRRPRPQPSSPLPKAPERSWWSTRPRSCTRATPLAWRNSCSRLHPVPARL